MAASLIPDLCTPFATFTSDHLRKLFAESRAQPWSRKVTERISKYLHLNHATLTTILSIPFTMSFLRRRILGGDSSSEPSRDPSPSKGEPVTLIPASQLEKLKTKTRSKPRTTLIFGLGGLFGIVLAAFFAQQHDVINLEGLVDFNLESLMDVIPAGIVNDAKDITVRCSLFRGSKGAIR